MSCVGDTCGVGGWGGPKPGDPSNNGVLSAKPAVGGIDLSWTYPTDNPHAVAHAIVYRSISNLFINAIQIATWNGDQYFDRVGPGVQYWYWIQFVSINGTILEPIGPATATAYSSVEQIIQDLTGKIDAGVLAQTLKERIDSITTLNSDFLEEVQNRFGADSAIADAVEQLQTNVDGAVALFQQEIVKRTEGDSALVDAMSLMGVRVGTNAAAIVEEATTRANAYEALAQRINTVESSGGAAGELIAQAEQRMETKIDAVKNTAESLYTVKLTSGDLIGGFGLYNSGILVEAGFDVDRFWIGRTNANKKKPFIIENDIVYMDKAFIRELEVSKITSGETNAEWRIRGQNGRIVMDNGAVMKVIGTGFGQNFDLISWFGPSMPIAQCSKANATTYEALDGSAYWGGALRAGILYNAQRTTQTAPNAEVPLGPFWSNGNPRNLVVSYSFSTLLTNRNPDGNGYVYNGGATYATIQLWKGNVLLQEQTFNGGYNIENEPDGTDRAEVTIGGSFTFTDTGGAGDYSYTARIVSRSTACIIHQSGSSTSVTTTQSLGIISTEQ